MLQKATSYYSAVIEQCFQQSKHFTGAPENITPKKRAAKPVLVRGPEFVNQDNKRQIVRFCKN